MWTGLTLLVCLYALPQDTIYLFYAPECPHCQKVLDKIKKKGTKYPCVILNIRKGKNLRILERFEKELDTFGEYLPIVYFNRKLFYGEFPDSLYGSKKKTTSSSLGFGGVCDECARKPEVKFNLS